MLACRRRDAEGLLHEPVRLVPVSFGLPLLILVTTAARVRRPARRSTPVVASSPLHSGHSLRRRVVESGPALALHLPVRQEAARDSARAPRLAVCPSSHSRFPLVPHEHRARPDRLPLLFRKSSLHPRQQPESTCLEQLDGIRRRADVAVVGLHSFVLLLKYGLNRHAMSNPITTSSRTRGETLTLSIFSLSS